MPLIGVFVFGLKNQILGKPLLAMLLILVHFICFKTILRTVSYSKHKTVICS